MNFFAIGKIRGVIFSVVIIGIYYWCVLALLHHSIFGFYPQASWETRTVFIGLFMTQFIFIKSGTQAELTFCGMVTGRIWFNGPALLPNILHVTIILFGFPVLWGVLPLKNNTYEHYKEPDIRIYSSDSNMKYHANVQMTYMQAQLSRISDIILRLLFDYKRVPEEYYVASLGYRVLFAGIIVVCVDSASVSTKTFLNQKINSLKETVSQQQQAITTKQSTKTEAIERRSGEIGRSTPIPPPSQAPTHFATFSNEMRGLVPLRYDGVIYNLIEGQFVKYMPNREWQEQEKFGLLGRGSDKVIFYSSGKNTSPANAPTFYPYQTPICLVIPRGEQVSITSHQPPTFVVNMNNRVLLGGVIGVPPVRQLDPSDPPSMHWGDQGSWKYLYDGWQMHLDSFGNKDVDQQGRETGSRSLMFHVKGPSKEEPLAVALQVGLVCFN